MGILVAHQNPLDMLICIGSMTKDWKILFEPVTALLQRNPGGRFYLPELKPGFGYRKKVAETKNKAKIIRKLEKIGQELKNKYKINSSMMGVDSKRLRILTSEAIARKIKEKNLATAVVREYPTYDLFEVEIELL